MQPNPRAETSSPLFPSVRFFISFSLPGDRGRVPPITSNLPPKGQVWAGSDGTRFRHSFSTLIHGMGTNLAVQKELLRHADIKTTMNIYTQAMAPAKRKTTRKLTKKL